MAVSAPETNEREFRYFASASLCAGEIVGAQLTASTCVLPADGGYTHLFWNRFSDLRNLEIGRGYAEGQRKRDEDLKVWQTRIRITLEKVNLGEVLTIGRITATLISSYSAERNRSEFLLLDATFLDVRIGGVQVNIELDQRLIETPLT